MLFTQSRSLRTDIRKSLFCFLLVIAPSAAAGEPIARSAQLPKTLPWDLVSLGEAPAYDWIDSQGPVRSLTYAGEPYRGKPTRVFAYYATPGTLAGDSSKDSQLPAVVLLHGGGGTAFREWAELWAKRGYAAIGMDLAGHQPVEGKNAHQPASRKRLPEGGPNQGDDEKFGSVDKDPAEQWTYHAVAAAIRAHSLIRSFKEVDSKRTAVTGISWGGYLTCIVAGVDSRFKAAVPVYGCGFLHENSAWLDRFAKMTPAQREHWITLWDPSQYLPAVSMPTLFMNGTNDFAYPLDSYMKSFDLVPAGKAQLCVTVNMPHGHIEGWRPKEIGLFIDHHLLGEKPLARLEEPMQTGDTIFCGYRSPEVKLDTTAVHWTTEEKPINQRSWQTSQGTVHEDRVAVETPPSNATAWFVTAVDTRGATTSSRIMFNSTKSE